MKQLFWFFGIGELLKNICLTVKTYFRLLNRTYFALLVVVLSNWALILRVVHQFSFHNPLSRLNTSEQWRHRGKQKDKTKERKRTKAGEIKMSGKNGDQSHSGWGKRKRKRSGGGQGVREKKKRCEKNKKWETKTQIASTVNPTI